MKQFSCIFVWIVLDFHKIGGFHILPLLLLSRHVGLRWRTADLIATLTQNNPYCQNAVLDAKLLPLLMKLLDDATEDEQVRVKALYALSCKLHLCHCKIFSSQNAFLMPSYSLLHECFLLSRLSHVVRM